MADHATLSKLATSLSSESRILTDHESPEFESSIQRWSKHGVKTPSAIIQLACEQDIVLSVQTLLNASIPFVAASGGHSPYSTIEEGGVVLDLSRYKGVNVNKGGHLATVRGGTLMKELQLALHAHKRFTAVGNGSTVGVIPYFIGGGISVYKPFVGYGAENIVAAKLVTATGDLVEVSETTNPELLWGVRGAGQFLGLITELTIKTYPYSLMGNQDGQRICGTYIFPVQLADAVCAALQPITKSEKYLSAGHLIIMMAPPDFKHQVVVVAPQVFCSLEEATELFQPLVQIGPIVQTLSPSTFDKHSDHLDYICAKGDFKKFTQNGMAASDWSLEKFEELIKLHAELVTACPDAAMSAYSVEWHTCSGSPQDNNTSFGLEAVDYWMYLSSWYRDSSSHEFVESMDKKAQAIMRQGTEENDFISYTNTNREDPLSYRYKGTQRVDRLQELKKLWDPKGVFTTQLL